MAHEAHAQEFIGELFGIEVGRKVCRGMLNAGSVLNLRSKSDGQISILACHEQLRGAIGTRLGT